MVLFLNKSLFSFHVVVFIIFDSAPIFIKNQFRGLMIENL